MKIEGSGSISKRHGSADLDPDPHQNVMDPEHCVKICVVSDWRGGVLRRGGVGPGPPGGGAGDEGADEEPVRRAGHGGGRALIPPPPLRPGYRAYHGGAAQVRQDCRGTRGKEGGVVNFSNQRLSSNSLTMGREIKQLIAK
jgi:hypothetical protein